MTARLKIVDQAPKPPIDLYAAWKAEVAAVNWSAVHCRGDRSAPVNISDAPKGRWSA